MRLLGIHPDDLGAAIEAALENRLSDRELEVLVERVLSDRRAWAFFVRQIAAHKMLTARCGQPWDVAPANSQPEGNSTLTEAQFFRLLLMAFS
jgi:hypothetical protein